MFLKKFFNARAEKRQAKALYKQLAGAIKAQDLKGVREALKNGADAGYMPGSNSRKKPLSLALLSGNAEIFSELLNTTEGKSTIYCWGGFDFRVHKQSRNGENNAVYFIPSYLYSAIELGKTNIARVLIDHPIIDVEDSGELFTGSAWKSTPEKLGCHPPQTPLELARDKGYGMIALAIEARLKNLLPGRLEIAAERKEAEARKKLAEADALNKEALELKEKALQLKKELPITEEQKRAAEARQAVNEVFRSANEAISRIQSGEDRPEIIIQQDGNHVRVKEGHIEIPKTTGDIILQSASGYKRSLAILTARSFLF